MGSLFSPRIHLLQTDLKWMWGENLTTQGAPEPREWGCLTFPSTQAEISKISSLSIAPPKEQVQTLKPVMSKSFFFDRL